MLGIILELISAASYNSAPAFMALAARAKSADTGGASLLFGVALSWTGFLGIALNLFGFALETVALTMLSLTYVRVLSGAGLILLLVLANRMLGEPIGRRDLLGVGGILGGIVVVGLEPPAQGALTPTPARWLVLLAVMVPFVLAPFLVGFVRRRSGAILNAVGAGMGYALSSLFTKGLAEGLNRWDLVGIALTGLAVTIAGIIAFVSELRALQLGRAATVEPILRGFMTVIPIVLAPFLFGEYWPAALSGKALLGGGIALTIVGVLILSCSSSGVLAGQQSAASAGAVKAPAGPRVGGHDGI